MILLAALLCNDGGKCFIIIGTEGSFEELGLIITAIPPKIETHVHTYSLYFRQNRLIDDANRLETNASWQQCRSAPSLLGSVTSWFPRQPPFSPRRRVRPKAP